MIPRIDSDAMESELAQMREMKLSREQVDEILKDLGKIVGLEDLVLDENGVAELTVDDSTDLSLIHLETFPGIVAAVAMPEGAEAESKVLRRLLQVNMSWSLTQGGSFVFVPPQLALCRMIPLTPGDSARLDRELATFVALGNAWRDEIVACLRGETPEDPATSLEDNGAVGLKV